MNATHLLRELGQSIWLDNITREMLGSGTLQKYIDAYSVTGLTSNPTIFDHAIQNSSDYDNTIRMKSRTGLYGEGLFFALAIEDLGRAADMFRPVWDRTNGIDGWVSLEVSPLIAYDTKKSIQMARDLHRRAGRPNVFIKIPGTREGLPAVEESIFAGVPVNVTLLFSREQYIAAADAYTRGIERRIEAGLNPNVPSVASLFISRWDVAVADKVPESLRNRLGIAIAGRVFKAYREQLRSPRWLSLYNHGAHAQRLLWASTGTKDPQASPLLYVQNLIAPYTINTMPEQTLNALAEADRIGEPMPGDGGDGEEVLAEFTGNGIDIDTLAEQLQREGAESFSKSWNNLLAVITSKQEAMEKAG
ncbi:transaldolase [bacterium]|nr:transaldolase [bacterium]